MNDELLGAYSDGELDAEKRLLIEMNLAQNYGAALRLENMKHADDLLREAIPRTAADVQDPMARLILENVTPMRRLPRFNRDFYQRVAAIAAAALFGVFVGVGGSGLTRAPAGAVDARMHVDAALASILDTTASGESAPIMGGEAKIALSVQTPDGRFCRQFRLTSGADVSDALACRDSGRWRMVVQSVAQAASDAHYQTAGAGAASPVDSAIDALGSSIVLDPVEERAAIAAHWRPSH